MTNYSNKTVCVVDNGLFLPIAFKLAQHFGQVIYFCPSYDQFPLPNRALIGDGYEEIKHTLNFFDIINKTDLFVFPDVGFGDLQNYLRFDLKKRVWGAGKGEHLELYREETKKLLERLKLPVHGYKVVKGIAALREHLRGAEDKYIKISRWRGLMETWHHINYKLSEPRIDELEHQLGAMKHIINFVVEDALEAVAEIGYDGWTIDGKFPSIGMLGYEIKDQGLIGAVMPYGKLPKEVRLINEKLSPVFRGYSYRGFFSDDIRVGKDGLAYLTDPTCRAPSPPSELYQELYSNWGEILWEGSAGEVVEPKPVAKYGVQALIKAEWSNKDWQPVYFPREIRQWVKLYNATRIRGVDYIVPQPTKMVEIGSVVAVDDTILGAIRRVKKYAAQIEGYSVSVKLDSIPEAIEAIAEGQANGIHFTDDKLPTRQEIDDV